MVRVGVMVRLGLRLAGKGLELRLELRLMFKVKG